MARLKRTLTEVIKLDLKKCKLFEDFTRTEKSWDKALMTMIIWLVTANEMYQKIIYLLYRAPDDFYPMKHKQFTLPLANSSHFSLLHLMEAATFSLHQKTEKYISPRGVKKTLLTEPN